MVRKYPIMRRAFYMLCGLITAKSMAAPLPVPRASGGIIDREIESQYEAQPIEPEKEVPDIEVELPEEQLSFPDDETVEIKKIEIVGNTLISESKLEKVISKYENTEMSMKDIQRLCKEIQKLYAKEGYFLVRVFPPVQTIRHGELKIEVLEVTIGSIFIEGNEHYDSKFVRKYFEKFEGHCVHYDDLMKKLLLLNEYSDLRVGVVFQKGETPGTTDMIVRVDDGRPLHLYADYNNYGSSVTSLWRVGSRAELGNLVLNGDQLNLIGVIGIPPRQLEFLDAIYNVPLNANGTKMEFATLYSHFHVDRLDELRLKGNSLVVTIKLQQAMIRTKSFSSDMYAFFDYMDIRNYEKGEIASTDDLRVLTGGWKFNNLDRWKGRNFGSIQASFGIPGFLDGLSAVDPNSSRPDTGGRFIFVEAQYQRLQKMPWHWFLYLNFEGQYSFYKLPISEEFYIGGITTVRGYPMATALGDSGFFSNIEARIPNPIFGSRKIGKWDKTWSEVLQWIAFVDYGQVYVKGGKGVVGQSGHVCLASAGIGARIFGPWNIDVNLDWGFPLKDQRKPSESIFYVKVSKRFL